MKLTRRGASTGSTTEVEYVPAERIDLRKAAQPPKGRATPKRRDAEGRRGPVSAPKTRKEAYARQKQLAREQRSSRPAVKPQSAAARREAFKRGDPAALPRRDRGNTRKLARDYVDAKRMLSHYLLWLFPLFVLTTFVPALRYLEFLVLLFFIAMLGEWFVVGRRVRQLAIERHGAADGSALSVGAYMGSRAYLPRRFRLPAPQVQRGDDI